MRAGVGFVTSASACEADNPRFLNAAMWAASAGKVLRISLPAAPSGGSAAESL